MGEYIYESNKNKELAGNEGIIVLPDIYMQTSYSKQTVERFAETFQKPVFMIDYFYLLTNQSNVLSENDREKVHGLMQNFKGDDFLVFFKKVLSEIKLAYPNLQKFTVIGFCFGGRLAYIAGGEPEVSKVISFYGGGVHAPNYVVGKTPVEYLVSKRAQTPLQIEGFFGIQDKSIPEEDRVKTKEQLAQAGVAYEAHEYEAGHAYFQEGRFNFNELASKASWEVLKKIFNG